jgi:hypothetical protein
MEVLNINDSNFRKVKKYLTRIERGDPSKKIEYIEHLKYYIQKGGSENTSENTKQLDELQILLEKIKTKEIQPKNVVSDENQKEQEIINEYNEDLEKILKMFTNNGETTNISEDEFKIKAYNDLRSKIEEIFEKNNNLMKQNKEDLTEITNLNSDLTEEKKTNEQIYNILNEIVTQIYGQSIQQIVTPTTNE